MNVIQEFNETANDLRDLCTRYEMYLGQMEKKKSSLTEQENEYEKISQEINTAVESAPVLARLIDVLIAQSLQGFQKMLDLGMKQIFGDQYSVQVIMEDKRNLKSVSFVLKEMTDEGVIESDINGEVGGGIQVIGGLISSVFVIMKSGSLPFMIVDEGLSQIADHYLPEMFALLKKISEQFGFVFVLVTHDSRFIPYADKVYNVNDGEYSILEREEKDENRRINRKNT